MQPFGEGLWFADGPDVASFGFRYPTRMVIIRLVDGGLFVWSPVALSDTLRGEVDAAGPVRFIVAPNTLHHLSIPEWQSAYPEARVYGAPGLQQRRKDIAFDGLVEEGIDVPWADQVDHVVMGGNMITTEVVFFHRESATVLFTDLIQNFDEEWFSGWRKIIARLDGMVGDEAQVPRKFRMAFTNRKAARLALERILQWPAEKVLMAHGTPVEKNGRDFIRRAFGWLNP